MLTITLTLGCKKDFDTRDKLRIENQKPTDFSKNDSENIKKNIEIISKSINFSYNNTAKIASNEIELLSRNTSLLSSGCESYLAQKYSSTCFIGYYSEAYITQYPYAHIPIHNSLSNKLDTEIAKNFNNFGFTGNSSYFLNDNNLRKTSISFLSNLIYEQIKLADSIDNTIIINEKIAFEILNTKIIEQQNRILNSSILNYDEKEFLITSLELEIQNRENYIKQYNNRIESSISENTETLQSRNSRKKTTIGKIWRGLAFVAITLATAGKGAVVIAKAAYLAAGKKTAWTLGAATFKKAYFSIGVGAAWVPTGIRLIEGEKWKYNPWGSGSFEDILKFGSNLIGIVSNPFFGWNIS